MAGVEWRIVRDDEDLEIGGAGVGDLRSGQYREQTGGAEIDGEWGAVSLGQQSCTVEETDGYDLHKLD